MAFIKNSAFHFMGGLIPAVASLVTVPVIVHRLGDESYGIFALVTAIVGYFALLDINATAGSVKYISEHKARGEWSSVYKIVSLGAMIYAGIGLIGWLLIALGADYLSSSVFNIPEGLRGMSCVMLQWAGFGFFLAQLQTYLQSVPQALERYDLSGKLEGLFGALVPSSTVAVVMLGGGLVEIIQVRIAFSVVNIVALVALIYKILPQIRFVQPDSEAMKQVGSFSAYAFLSKVATTFYINADKLIIGAVMDMRALSAYTIPFLLVNRVFGLVYRVGQVIFPMSSALAARGEKEKLAVTYLKTYKYIAYLNTSLAIVIAFHAVEIIRYWVGGKVSPDASVALVILSFGVLIDSFTNVPSLVNDGLGNPRNTGVFAVTRAIVGVVFALIGINLAGVMGAAVAQFSSSLIMTVAFLVYIHKGALPATLNEAWQGALQHSFFPLVVLGSLCAYRLHDGRIMSPSQLTLSVALCGLALISYGLLVVANSSDRKLVQDMIQARFKK
jgi:O-antigen/teichoic acid export membrane protein